MANSQCCPPCPPPVQEHGFIRARSYTGSNSLPVANVKVTLTRVDIVNAADNVSFNTGSEGLSEDIRVSTPLALYSLDENNTTVLPYAIYNVFATVDGYEDLFIEGVQVFAQQIAMLELAMIPQNSEQAAIGDNEFIVPEHHLFAGTGGSAPAPIEVCPIPRVLDEVIIPKTITIHLGRPSSSARDVTVSFSDYIKNVASSEIYPTWPEESLRANIHAQISLALNRVFTEWYKSKGYPFQITNSTSFDQYYIHGRNIFDNISKIVDDIFNTYVRRPGTIDPYYTEYCDGKQVTCKGMKQWGTVTLAQQGLNALQILRNYYGNVDIVRTNNIQSIPESYPGTPLREGSTGADVRTIQRQLNRISKDYPFFGTVSTDGVFGASTTAIVKKFQKQFSLTQDGVVGRSTWYKISYIYVAVKKLAELTSEGEKPNGDLVAGQYPGTALRIGSTGSTVEEVQFWLNTVGQFVTTIPAVALDGIFGVDTERAVRAFQQHFGLGVDGVVGKQTWDSLYAEYKSIVMDTSPPNTNSPGQFPGTTLRVGSRGDDVKRFQFFLRIIARYNSSIPSVNADGIFGTATENAVRRFQTFYGLASDGLVGKLTWNKMYEVYTDLLNQILAPTARPGTYPGTPLRQGSSGITVKEMQYYLFILSAYYTQIPTIAFDGLFGAATTAAVRAFQSLAGLTVDGVVGRQTWDALYARFQKLRNTDGLVFAFDVLKYPGQEITPGSNGSNVVFIQYLLSYIGWFFDVILPVELTGIYDEATTLSVRSFQELLQLPVTGIVNEATWNDLVTVWINLAGTAGEDNQTAPGEYPGFVLRLGSAGNAVRSLQTYINGIATRYCVQGFVPEDGIFGVETEAAVREFQQGFGLDITGIVDKQTWDTIYSFYIMEG